METSGNPVLQSFWIEIVHVISVHCEYLLGTDHATKVNRQVDCKPFLGFVLAHRAHNIFCSDCHCGGGTAAGLA
jgi:hypothetical protein